MKKILALCLAMLMVLSLTAVLASCGGKTEETGTKAPETPTQESKTETSSKEPTTQEPTTGESVTESASESVAESDTDPEVPSETDSEPATDPEVPTETDSEPATDPEVPTETESATEKATETESESESKDPVDPVTGNFETVISYPWYDFNFSDGKQFGFTDEDGLKEKMVIDMHEKGLDCATPNGYTQIVVYYVPSRLPNGKVFTGSDYLSFSALRGVSDGSYTFGAKFLISLCRGLELNNTLYNAANNATVDRLKFSEVLSEKYVMFIQVFTAERQSLWVDGHLAYSCPSSYPNQSVMGLTTAAHKYMMLNGAVQGNTMDADATDLYATYRVRLMYATGYAYAADEKAVATFFQYYKNEEELPEPSVKHELTFVDPEASVSFNQKDDSPSNLEDVLAKKYFEFDFSSKNGLKEIMFIDLQKGKDENGQDYWKGRLAGTTLVGLYYIPDVNYTNKDFIGFMQYEDATPGDFDGALQYNLGDGTVSALSQEKFLNSTNSISKKFHVTGWTLFVQTYDGTMMKLWCNGELVFIGDATGTRVQQYILGYNVDAKQDVRQYLVKMVINGYAPMKTPASNAIDLYDKYGIKMDYAAMYALGANDNAAKEIFNKFVDKYELKAPTIE